MRIYMIIFSLWAQVSSDYNYITSERVKFLNFPRPKNAQLTQTQRVPMRPPFRET